MPRIFGLGISMSWFFNLGIPMSWLFALWKNALGSRWMSWIECLRFSMPWCFSSRIWMSRFFCLRISMSCFFLVSWNLDVMVYVSPLLRFRFYGENRKNHRKLLQLYYWSIFQLSQLMHLCNSYLHTGP